MERIELKPGMRVRCVNSAPRDRFISVGTEYTIKRLIRHYLWLNEIPGTFFADRFKPIVRVKARCVPSLSVMISRAMTAVARMTPAEEDAMYQAQRDSWVRGQTGWD